MPLEPGNRCDDSHVCMSCGVPHPFEHERAEHRLHGVREDRGEREHLHRFRTGHDTFGCSAIPGARERGRSDAVGAQDSIDRRCHPGGVGANDLIRAVVTVIGRSVLSRNVRQGTPSTVVSSCIPPESVNTRRALSMSARKSRYPSGSTMETAPERSIVSSRPNADSRARARMQGEQNGNASRNAVNRTNRIFRIGEGVDVAGPVQRAQRIAARLEDELPQDASLSGALPVVQQRIDHHIADEVNLVGRHALGTKIVGGGTLRCEQIVGDLVGEESIDLFGHPSIVAAQARFDMRDGMPRLTATSAHAKRRIDVSDDDNGVGRVRIQIFVERHHHARGLCRMASRPYTQIRIRFRKAELVEE